MYRTPPGLAALLLLAASLPAPAAAQAQAEQVAREVLAEEAALLLRRAPSMELPGALTAEGFLDETNYLKSLEGSFGRVATTAEAFEALLELAAFAGPVFADVRSTPVGATVHYRISFQEASDADPATTTPNPSLRLDVPAYYWFRVTRGDTIQEKLVNCLNGCTVQFELGPEGPGGG